MNGPTRNIDELFLLAVEKVQPEDWPQFVQQMCGGDADSERQLTRLFAAHCSSIPALDRQGAAGLLLSECLGQAGAEMALSGTSRYRLVERIGYGGHGVVFRARQISPLQREVAVKLVLLPGGGQSLGESLQRERLALQRLQHPGICQILDAGCAECDEPYLVMELVEGPRLTDYAVAEELSLAARLELFGQLCDAVQYAHDNQVIHRDLKPANVLVSRSQGAPQIKVVDFGISRIMAECGADQTALTTGSPGGTLEYTSPEQAGATQCPIGIATDVYALGAVLFELLTGQRAFPNRTGAAGAGQPLTDRFAPTDVDELLVHFRQFAQGHADYPHAQLKRWAAILSMALRWTPDQRYASVRDLQDDVARCCSDLPLKARPETPPTRWLRQAVRYRRPLLRALFGLIAAALLIVAAREYSSQRTLQQQLKTEQATADQAELVSAITSRILRDALSRVVAAEKAGEDKAVERALQSIRELERELLRGHIAETRARVQLNLANAYLESGQGALARQAAEEAYGMSADSRDLLRLRVEAGCVLLSANIPQTSAEAAVAFSGEVLGLVDPQNGSLAELHAKVVAERVKWLVLAGRAAEARQLLDEALPLAEARLPASDLTRWSLVNDRLSLQIQARESADAERTARHYLGLPVEQQCPIGAGRMSILLADLLTAQGRVEEAVDLLQQQIAIMAGRSERAAATASPASPASGSFLTVPLQLQLARLLEVQGKLSEAFDTAEVALDPIQVAGRPSEMSWIFRACALQGRILAKQGHFQEAEPHLRRAVEIAESGQLLKPAAEALADNFAWLGICLNKQGRRQEARQALDGGLKTCREIYGADAEPTRKLASLREKLGP